MPKQWHSRLCSSTRTHMQTHTYSPWGHGGAQLVQLSQHQHPYGSICDPSIGKGEQRARSWRCKPFPYLPHPIHTHLPPQWCIYYTWDICPGSLLPPKLTLYNFTARSSLDHLTALLYNPCYLLLHGLPASASQVVGFILWLWTNGYWHASNIIISKSVTSPL